MTGKNYGICHSCRRFGHYLLDCPNLRKCPKCGKGFVTWMEVEKKNENEGRLFFGCSRYQCNYFVWSDEASPRRTTCEAGQSSSAITNTIEDLTRIFQNFARISEDTNVEISFTLTMRIGKGNGEDDKGKEGEDDKGKGKM